MARDGMEIDGFAELINNLNELKDKTEKKITRAGVNAGLTPLAKTIRKGVNGSSASPAVKKEARRTVGKKLKRVRGTYVGKAGFAVGKPTSSARTRAKARANADRPGVGLSWSNIHWFVLPMAEREQETTGRATGKVEPVLQRVIPTAARIAGPLMLEAYRRKSAQVLEREVQKMRK